MFQIHLRTLEVDNLPVETTKRVGYSVLYEYEKPYIYIVGGMDIITYDHIDWFRMFNI